MKYNIALCKKIMLAAAILIIAVGGYACLRQADDTAEELTAADQGEDIEEDMPVPDSVDDVEEDLTTTDQEDDVEEELTETGQEDDIEEDMSASDSVDYVDEELYAEIKDIYKNIDFTAFFDPGDVTKYDLYKEKYKKFVNGEATAWVRETGEELYIYNFHGLEEFRTAIELGEYDAGEYDIEEYHIKDRYSYRYYFFDINGDENPELCIMNQWGYIYVFQYNEERDQIVLWKEYISNTIFLMGTQKLGWAGGWSGDGMIRVDEKGDYVFFVRFKVMGGRPYQNDIEDYGYLVFLPEYIELREDMLEQAIYDETDEQYCFRVTEEQFEEITKDYNEARKASDDALDEVMYTYAELFD